MYQMTMPKPTIAVEASLMPKLFEMYLVERIREGRITPLTVKSYRCQVAPFLVWLDQQPNKMLTPESFAAFLDWMKHSHLNARGQHPASNTMVHSIHRLIGFFNWCHDKNCTSGVKLSEWLPRLRKKQTRQHFPDVSEMQHLFSAITGVDRLRNWALLGVLLSTGARLEETSHALVRNITFTTPASNLRYGGDHRGSIWLQRVKFDAEGEGAGRDVVFDSKTGLLLKIWLKAGEREPNDTIFGLGGRGISILIQRLTEREKMAEVSPHAFRRAFADHWDAAHGMAARAVLKRQLGHSLKGDVTQNAYISQNPRRIVAEIMKWHVSPMEQITIDWTTLPVHFDD